MNERPRKGESSVGMETFRFVNHDTRRLVIFRAGPLMARNDYRSLLLAQIQQQSDWLPVVTRESWKDLARSGYRAISSQTLLKELLERSGKGV